MSAVSIQYVELDTATCPTSHDTACRWMRSRPLLFTATRFVRNKRSAAGDYVAVGNGIRVNFIYRPREYTARPISAWRQ